MCVRRGAVNHNGVSSSLLKHTQPSLTPLAHLLHLCFLSKLRPARSCEAKSTSLNLNLIHRHSRKTKQSNATMEIRTLSFPAIVRRLYRWLWLPSLPALLFQSILPYLLTLLPRFSSLMGIHSSSFSIKICFFFLKLRFCVSVFIFTYMGLFSWTDVLGFVSLFCLWCNYIVLLLPRLIGIPLHLSMFFIQSVYPFYGFSS